MASILLSKQPDEVHNSSKVIDPHAPILHPTVKHSIHEQVEVSASSGSVSYGATNTIFKLPREGYLSEIYLDIDYTDNVAGDVVFPNASHYLSLVTAYELRIGSNTVFRMNNYHEFITYILAKMPAAKRAMFYGLAGTAAADYPSMMIPLWTPFSKLLNNDEGLSDFPLFAVDGDIELIISFNNANNTGGTIGTISGQVLLQRSLVDSFDRNMSWSCHSIDIQEGPARTGYTTTASRNFESHVSGSVKELFLYLTTDAAQTALDYITVSLPTALNIYHDGVQVDSLNSANEIKLRMAMSMGYEINTATAAGDCAIIHFSPYNGTSVAGSGFRIERGSLETEVTCGAASYGRWYGLVAATYAIQNGRFFKKL